MGRPRFRLKYPNTIKRSAFPQRFPIHDPSFFQIPLSNPQQSRLGCGLESLKPSTTTRAAYTEYACQLALYAPL